MATTSRLDDSALRVVAKDAASGPTRDVDTRASDETDHLLGSPENARRLLKSIAELEAGGGSERELKD